MKKRLHSQNRKILVLDLVTMTIAYGLALVVRFGGIGQLVGWQLQMYTSIYILEMLIYIVLNVALDRHRKKQVSIARQDPLDVATYVLRVQFLELVLLTAALGVSRMMMQASRRFMLYNFALCLVLVIIEREAYRVHRRRKAALEPAQIHYLLVTTRNEVRAVVQSLKDMADQGGQLDAILLVGDDGRVLKNTEKTCCNLPVLEDLGTVQEEVGKVPFVEAFVCLPTFSDEVKARVIGKLADAGIDSALSLTLQHDAISKQMIHTVGSYQAAVFTSMRTRCRIFGIRYSVTNVEAAVIYIKSHVKRLAGEYLCFSNVHTSVLARQNESYRNVQNSSAFTFPDGSPIALIEAQRGYPGASKVSGPDFMEAMFRQTCDGSLSHYFYGSTPDTIELLRKRLPEQFPGIRIAGMESPPFRKLTKEEDEAAIRRMNESGADIIWIGLGAPKQEEWMYEHKDKLNGLMCGVGAGFNFHAGNIRRAPVWMQRTGLEWLYRIFQDPKRLIGRYVKSNLAFFYYYVKDREWRNKPE